MIPPLAFSLSHAALLINCLLCISYCVTCRQLHNSPIYTKVCLRTRTHSLWCSTACPKQTKPAGDKIVWCMLLLIASDLGFFLMEDAKAGGKRCQRCVPPGCVVAKWSVGLSAARLCCRSCPCVCHQPPAFCLMWSQRPQSPSQVRGTRERPASRGKSKSSTSPRRRAARSELAPCYKRAG